MVCPSYYSEHPDVNPTPNPGHLLCLLTISIQPSSSLVILFSHSRILIKGTPSSLTFPYPHISTLTPTPALAPSLALCIGSTPSYLHRPYMFRASCFHGNSSNSVPGKGEPLITTLLPCGSLKVSLKGLSKCIRKF